MTRWWAGWLVLAATACAAPQDPAPSRAAQRPLDVQPVTEPARTTSTEAQEAAAVQASASEPTAGAAPAGEETKPAAGSITVREIRVPGDASVLVVPGRTPTPIVYLHGRCGDPRAFTAWAEAGVEFGTIVSIKGDQKCKAGGRTKWTEDPARLDRRITKALDAVSQSLGVALDGDRRLVIGYSQGALRAESLGTKYPERYPRAVLIAGPRAPRPTSLTKSEAVLLVVGDHDARQHLSEAASKLARAGRAVRYLELPGARHGEYGSEARRVFTEGLGWLVGTPTDWRDDHREPPPGAP